MRRVAVSCCVAAAAALSCPLTGEQMVTQAAQALERAFDAGHRRLTIRFPLTLGLESDDARWFAFAGGAPQMALRARPLAAEILKRVDTAPRGEGAAWTRPPPKIVEQTLWDFDGSYLLTAEAATGAANDVQLMLMPNTDLRYLDDLETIETEFGRAGTPQDRLVVLANPAWRDEGSFGWFDRKRGRELLDAYPVAYALESTTVSNMPLWLLKGDCDGAWTVFEQRRRRRAPGDAPPPALGTFPARPRYDDLAGLVGPIGRGNG